MGSQLFEVLRQGIWASLTGGWFHDPRQPTLTNTIHLYLWLILLAFPLTLSVYFTSTITTWSAYAGSIGILFITIKILNCRFHYLFDTTEPIEEKLENDEPSTDKPAEAFEQKNRRERPKNLGLAAADEIELQVMESSGIESQIAHTECLLNIEDNSSPIATRACGISGGFKVDVHRKESSSSSISGNSAIKDSIEEIIVVDRKQSKEDLEDLSITCSIPIAADDNTSPTSQDHSMSSGDVLGEFQRASKRFPNYSPSQSELMNSLSSTNNLKGTTSLELGYVLSHKEALSNEAASQQFRRTQSAQETSSRENRREALLHHLQGFPSTKPCLKSSSNKKDTVQALSLQSLSVDKPSCLKRSQSQDNAKLSSPNVCGESENEEEEVIRSTTPLLHRASESLKPLESNSNKKRSPKGEKKTGRLTKKVSFTTRSSSSSSGSEAYAEGYSPPIKETEMKDSPDSPLFLPSGRRNSKFALVPAEESLVGWNQSGGPFTSQWLFQAVNPTTHLDLNLNSPVRRKTSVGSPVEEEEDNGAGETESIKSEDSESSHSFSGISKLFELEDSLVASEPNSERRSIRSHKLSSRPIPPKKPPRTVHPAKVSTSRMLLAGDDDRRRKLLGKPTRTQDPPYGLGPGWRLEREMSPRVLERLLEESQESGHGRSPHCRGGSPTRLPFLEQNEEMRRWPEFGGQESFHWKEAESGGVSVRNTRVNRVPRGSRRQSADEQQFFTTLSLVSARDIENHLRSLRPQSSLDVIGGPAERQGSLGSSARNSSQLQGFFRGREENLPDDIHLNAAAVNRHRRLRRLTHSRRTLERRRENTPVLFPQAPSTHIANSHDDTTEGALHYFQDEKGDWFSYTFSEKGASNPVPAEAPPSPRARANRLSTILNRIDLGSSAFIEPRQAGSNTSRLPVASTSTQSGILKTPSSSESWSSVSSSELTVDPTHKLYPSYRRGVHQSMGIHQQGPLPSIPPVDYQTITSAALTHAMRTSMPLPGISGGIAHARWQRNPRDVLSVLTESFLERRRLPSGPYAHGEAGAGFSLSSEANSSKKQTKYYYWMNPIPFFSSVKLKVSFDRLNLVAILDRNKTLFENLLGILLAVGVASLGAFMLHSGYYQDFWVALLCAVMASCQFSLLKSVQPDAASPTHGFNRIVAFSRPIYFCLCGSLIFLLQTALDQELTDIGWNIYGLDITNRQLLTSFRDLILTTILAFPLLFCVGLIFPQFNTFMIFLLEQADVHVFGGSGAAGLWAATVSNLKNWVAVGCLYGFAYGSLGENAKPTQNILFSIFCALLVPVAYHLSRCSSDSSIMWDLLKQQLCLDEDCFGESVSVTANQKEIEDQADPLPKKLRNTVNARLKSDTIVCPVLAILIFALHSSTVFSALQPGLMTTLWVVAVAVGFLLHYVYPELRTQFPCQMVAHPILLSGEHSQFEARDAAKFMWFEKFYIVACFLERNVLYPLMFISALTQEAGTVVEEKRFGLAFGSLVVVITALKAFRTSYSDPSKHYLILTFTILFFEFDWKGSSETFVVDFFFMSILFQKVYELWLKLQFVTSYVSPWQISWGSAFHAFAQPFSVPHSAMLFLQALISSFFSAPLNPFLGSAIFITSYVRPIKFWERDYNTKRVDHSNTRLSSHLEKNPGADDNNLNSIFYEHLTRSLQDSLCGDVALGRWGLVSQGDCFVLASDYLNCLVHVIEIGNGLITFQMRGLEFRGTYCQQREVEAISEGVEEDDGCCCCEPGHLPHFLSANAAFSQRWLAWEVTVSKYVLEGYNISDNSAVSMLQVYDLRKILITYYVKSVIFYTIKAEKLREWLELDSIRNALKATLEKSYAELDPIFNVNIDEDYDFTTSGITRNSFCNVYHSWIQFCLTKRENGNEVDCQRNSAVVSLCFALSILARRALGIAAHSNSLSSVEFFLFGLHALFKGDFRITSQRDEWVFTDMDLLKKVVSPAVRMSLKLHQDHFMCPDEYDDHNALFDAISYHEIHLVISHEGDPAWRSAVLAGREGLLALRHVFDDGADEYKIIMLNKRHLSFRVIKLNRECVRGLWAGQQQELVYLRNRDPERGSIQNAKQALRNIINSSCDQPIGYPIYVSPLTTSYAETHPQLVSLLGGPISLSKIKESGIELWRRVRRRCGQGCSSGSVSVPQEDGGDAYAMAPLNSALPPGGINLSASQSLDGSQLGGSSLGRGSVGRNLSRGSGASNVSFGKPSSSTLASLAGFLTDANGNSREKDRGVEGLKWGSFQKVRIIDANQVYDGLNMGRRIDVVWPDDTMRARGGRSYWKNWVPEDGMEGVVVHKWIPGHRDIKSRSITDKTILLLRIEEKFVPIAESGVERIESEP